MDTSNQGDADLKLPCSPGMRARGRYGRDPSNWGATGAVQEVPRFLNDPRTSFRTFTITTGIPAATDGGAGAGQAGAGKPEGTWRVGEEVGGWRLGVGGWRLGDGGARGKRAAPDQRPTTNDQPAEAASDASAWRR